jgi:hypothetical protein
MKKHHTSIVLLTLFFAGLFVLWWAEYTEVPTEEELKQRVGLVLPELARTQVGDIRRLEVVQGKGREKGAAKTTLVFERRNDGWQMVEPLDAAADPTLVETLAQNLKGLRKSPDAGTIHDPAANYGLDPPVAVVRAFGKDKTLLAALEIGKSSRDQLFVRLAKSGGIDVVDARLLKGVEQPPSEWRDKSVFNLPSFQVAGLSVSGPGRSLKAERGDRHWTLLKPVRAAADDLKMEEVLAELTSLRVTNPSKGFVASNVRDLKPYGLDKKSAIRVELIPVANRGEPQVLLVGKPSSDEEGKRFAMRSDQDDVILVDGKGFRDLGANPNALRSKKLASFNASLVDAIRIEAFGRVFALARTGSGWELVQPSKEKADAQSVPGLLARLADLETSDFLDARRVPDPELGKSPLTIQVWQAKRAQKGIATPDAGRKDEPAFELKIGRHDVLKKTLYAQVPGDPTILALPDTLLEVLPHNEFAYRNRSVVTLSPSAVERFTIERDGRKFVLAPGKSNAPNSWRMEAPVEAPANEEAVTRALMMLSQLTAERLEATLPTDEAAFGLNAPTLRVMWTTRPQADDKNGSSEPVTKTLRVGSKVPGKDSKFASVSGSPFVFTLTDASLQPFQEEFRSRRVLSFSSKQVERLILKWPGRTLAFSHYATPQRGSSNWDAEPGADTSGFDASRLESLASDLARLQTRKFFQYSGPIPEATGLAKPALVIEVRLSGSAGTRRLRVGKAAEPGEFFATTAEGSEGPVFLLSGTGWAALVTAPVVNKLPNDVFTPPPAKPSK